jgi:uncharacterized protein (DUF1330 family)
MEGTGGKFIIRTNNITDLDGAPPKRFVVIAFDSVEKAKSWDSAPAQKEVNDLRKKSTKSRVFIAEGMSN